MVSIGQSEILGIMQTPAMKGAGVVILIKSVPCILSGWDLRTTPMARLSREISSQIWTGYRIGIKVLDEWSLFPGLIIIVSTASCCECHRPAKVFKQFMVIKWEGGIC